MGFNESIHRNDVSYYGRVKLCPDGTIEIMASEKPIFRFDGWEDSGWNEPPTGEEREAEKDEPTEDDLERSRRRAAARIKDIALCSNFEWFVTLTLSAEMIDRYDYDKVIRKLGIYLSNRVQRQNLRYLLVCERHKDGALHFHGFFGGLPDKEFVPTGLYTGGTCLKRVTRRPESPADLEFYKSTGAKEVHNIPSWKYGFTTAVRLSDGYYAAITYVSKYIRKSTEKIGGRWYLSGGDLKLPEKRLCNIGVAELRKLSSAYTFCVPGNGLAIWRGKKEDLPAEYLSLIEQAVTCDLTFSGK